MGETMVTQSQTDDTVPIRIPRNIYNWLAEVAPKMGLTPDGLASFILGRFWEINKAITESISLQQPGYKEDITRKLDVVRAHKSLVKRFLAWTESRGLTPQDLTYEHIIKFLEEYAMGKSLSKKTISNYRHVLSTYLSLVKEYGLSRKEILGER